MKINTKQDKFLLKPVGRTINQGVMNIKTDFKQTGFNNQMIQKNKDINKKKSIPTTSSIFPSYQTK